MRTRNYKCVSIQLKVNLKKKMDKWRKERRAITSVSMNQARANKLGLYDTALHQNLMWLLGDVLHASS